jgi:Flp pilus assembly protein TadG
MNPLKRFKAECKGNVAIMFAVATLPILVASGVAIDYSRAVSRRTILQNALDAAVLSASRQTGTTQTDNDFKNLVEKYIEASKFGAVETVTFVRSGTTATATVEAKVPTTIMGVIGIPDITVKAFTNATWSSAEIVLVLDSSNNLSATMTTLRNDALDFINDIIGSDGAVKIALMPFAVSARLDVAAFRGSPWLLIPNEGSTPDQTTCVDVPNPPTTPPPSGGGEDGEDGEDGGGSSGGGTSGGGTTKVCTTTPGTPANPWSGCVTDRAMTLNLDTNDTYYNNDNAKKYPAILDCRTNEENNLANVVPLTGNRSTITSGISALRPGGGTNMTIGVAWGNAMLSSIAPFPVSSAAGMRKIIILVSGGPNTESGNLPAGTPQANLNARTLMACTAAETAGVEVYTVNIQQNPSAAQVQLLQNCASEPGYYFDAMSAGNSLPKVFETLSRTMRQPRLTH